MRRPAAVIARVAAVALTAAVGLSAVAASVLRAQTVVEVQGGGSSLLGGYGATANFWRNGVDGWVGLGYLNGLRAGAFFRTGLGKDTLRVGNDALLVRFPTDIFGPGNNLLVQGMSYAGGTSRTAYQIFGGASSDGLGAPSFQPTSIESPLGALFVAHRVSPRVRLTGAALVAGRQMVMPGVQWHATPDIVTALVAGVGTGRPYAASSVVLREGALGLRALYAWNPQRFRRAPVPTPNQTEVDRENFQLTYELSPDFSVGLGRQNFVQDSTDGRAPVRATGNSLFGGGRWRDFRLTAGLYDSRSQGIANLSSYLGVGREVARWLDAEIFVLQSRPEGAPVSTTPIANLRWRLSPRVGLMQQLSVHDGRPTVLLGATVRTGIGELGADYQIVHQPFEPFRPFRSTLNLTARLQLGGYSTSIGTYVQPDGSVDYSASGSTFLYMGAFGGVQPNRVGGAVLGRYIVRGVVRDEAGAPVEGAALELGGQVTFTNSSGEFFVRARRPHRYALVVKLEEFLLPGRWRVVAAPAEVRAEAEDGAGTVEIVLQRFEDEPGDMEKAPPP
jgi:hypothetical protein